MTDPKYTRIQKTTINRFLRHGSPFFVDKQWQLPEAALAAAVIENFIMETVYSFTRAYRCREPEPVLSVQWFEHLRAIRGWCAFIGLAPDICKRMFEDMEVL